MKHGVLLKRGEMPKDAFRMCFSFSDIGVSFFSVFLMDQVEEFLLEQLTCDVDEEYVRREWDPNQISK
jgi:hypothetical protein